MEEKPVWAQFQASAEWHYREGQRLGRKAFATRCKQTEGGEEQCTQDAGHAPPCRIRDEDRP